MSHVLRGFPDGLAVKNLPATQETVEMLVWSLGREDPPEEEMASHSSILTWKIPRTGKPGGLQSMRLLRVRRNWAHTSFIGIFCSRYCARIFLLAPGGFHSVLLSGHHGTTHSSLCPPCLKTDLQMECIFSSVQFSSVGQSCLTLYKSSVSDTPPGEVSLCGAGSLLELFFCFLCGAPLPEEVFAMGMVTGQWAQKVSGMRMGPSLASPALRGGEGGTRRAREVSPPPHLAPTCGWQPLSSFHPAQPRKEVEIIST